MQAIFKRNEHKVERVLRIFVGLALLSVFIFDQGAWWALLGVLPLLTGVMGTCPVYSLFGFSTCPRDGTC